MWSFGGAREPLAIASYSCGVSMSLRKIVILLAALFIATVPQTARANIIGPALLPGVGQLFGLLAIPAAILTAYCECPFVRQAGVRQQPLFHCFCANLITTFVGFLLIPISVPALFAIGPIWVVLLISLSIWIEGLYYRKLALIRGGKSSWLWIVAGNVASAVLLIVVSEAAYAIETPFRARRVELYWWPLMLATFAGGGVGFLLGLRRAIKSRACDNNQVALSEAKAWATGRRDTDLVSTAAPGTMSSTDKAANSEQPQSPAPPDQPDG